MRRRRESAIAAAGCSSSGSSSSSGGTASAAPSGTAVNTSQCGTKPGVKATGTPIPLGAIATNQPGTSFTDIPNMAAAYFACVNANGGINGHPIKLYIETEQTNPAQIAADAKQLVQTDHVVGIVGNTSILECTIDHSYWEKLGYFVVDSGIAPECYSTPNSAAVNMGPRYSSDGAVQYALSQHVSKVVLDQSNVPGTGYIAAGPAALAAAAHTPIVQLTENVPISDANSVAIKEVNDAGPNGDQVAARVSFSGPFAGSVVLRADASLLQPLAANMLGLILYTTSRYEQAAAVFEQLVQRSPAEPMYWMNLGTARRGEGKIDAALAAYARAAALGAATADVREGRAGPVPGHLRDAHYRGAQRLGHGRGYDYPHEHPGGIVAKGLRQSLEHRGPQVGGREAHGGQELLEVRGLIMLLARQRDLDHLLGDAGVERDSPELPHAGTGAQHQHVAFDIGLAGIG